VVGGTALSVGLLVMSRSRVRVPFPAPNPLISDDAPADDVCGLRAVNSA
jgi:hypothetical protein